MNRSEEVASYVPWRFKSGMGALLTGRVSSPDACVALYFFFSSRRRHTRLQGDWSSDVCSSDLAWFAMNQASTVIPRWSQNWRPDSWQTRPAVQLPEYPDRKSLDRTLAELA